MRQYSEDILSNIKKVSEYKNLPEKHFKYLLKLKHDFNFQPKVIYNIGSPEREVVIEYLESQGFKNMGMFSDNGPDGDYHFMR